MKIFFILGSIFAFLGVAAGAFGAHALKNRLTPEYLSIFEVAVRYQMYHALALFVVAITAISSTAGWLFTSGILLFSGSLYILTWTGVSAWGMITPIGGFLLLCGWLALLFGFMR